MWVFLKFPTVWPAFQVVLRCSQKKPNWIVCRMTALLRRGDDSRKGWLWGKLFLSLSYCVYVFFFPGQLEVTCRPTLDFFFDQIIYHT